MAGDPGQPAGFDWPSIEESLGLSLPDDYKALVEMFPKGRFQDFVSLIRPGDVGGSDSEYLGYYEHRLNDMRGWREDEPQRFPLSIFPEPGGLLPWGVTNRGDLFFWQTEETDPNLWPVVISDYSFSFWRTLPLNVSELLVEVLSGRFDGTPFEVDLTGTPRFRPVQPVEASVEPESREDFWLDHQLWPEEPPNEYAALVDLLGPGPVDVRPVDWAEVEQRLGLRLPSDYKAFIDGYGPGTFRDITIAAPDTSADLYDRARQQGDDAPIHPEPGGLIAWGETPDGWICGWAPTGPDPDLWGVVLLVPSQGGWEYLWGRSFSSLLVKYAQPADLGFFLGRDIPPLAEPLFAQY